MDLQQMAMQMLMSKMGGTPLGNNLLELAKKGDSAGIEMVARNFLKQQGRDFDKEFSAFKEQMGFK